MNKLNGLIFGIISLILCALTTPAVLAQYGNFPAGTGVDGTYYDFTHTSEPLPPATYDCGNFCGGTTDPPPPTTTTDSSNDSSDGTSTATPTPAPSLTPTPIPLACGSGTARATGLVSTPNLASGSNFGSTGACIIDDKTSFRFFKIPSFDDLKSIYYNQK